MLAGEIEVSVGTGFGGWGSMTNVTASDVPPPGAGLDTVVSTDPEL